MTEIYDVAVRVISQEGTCEQGHKVGDEWVITRTTPAGLCLSAFHSLYPAARVLKHGGSFPWSSDPDAAQIACPMQRIPLYSN